MSRGHFTLHNTLIMIKKSNSAPSVAISRQLYYLHKSLWVPKNRSRPRIASDTNEIRANGCFWQLAYFRGRNTNRAALRRPVAGRRI
ncbi:hypothetical protein PUN28_016622 [Cardiocondyla obscurior]|uniref:Uncharacterized protein n=1 Tax=Cardiocondyla obscurior TaxID=286306 RepID=A0AAW2EPN0_9HYME